MRKNYILLALIWGFGNVVLAQRVDTLKKHPNGKPAFLVFYNKNNEKVKEVEYYETGQIEHVGEFKNGKEHGKWIYYYPNGKTKSIQQYKEGKEHGKFKFFDENGKIIRIELYNMGQFVKKIEKK